MPVGVQGPEADPVRVDLPDAHAAICRPREQVGWFGCACGPVERKRRHGTIARRHEEAQVCPHLRRLTNGCCLLIHDEYHSWAAVCTANGSQGKGTWFNFIDFGVPIQTGLRQGLPAYYRCARGRQRRLMQGRGRRRPHT